MVELTPVDQNSLKSFSEMLLNRPYKPKFHDYFFYRRSPVIRCAKRIQWLVKN